MSLRLFRMIAPAPLVLLLTSLVPAQDEPVDFASVIQPILESSCLSCHREDHSDGELRLDSRAAALKGGDNGPALVPKNPADSLMYARAILPPDHDLLMPPEGGPLDPTQTELLRRWILLGAEWPEDVTMKVQPRIDFVTHVQPILEQNCLSCHSGDEPDGGLDLATEKAAFTGGDSGPVIVAFDSAASSLFTLTAVAKDADELMPPSNAGGPLTSSLTERLRMWIDQGAVWPDGMILKPAAKAVDPSATPDNLELVQTIHAKIVAVAENESAADITDYKSTVPLTGAPYHMVAIGGGEFVMGSPPNEADRTKAEGPQTNVTVSPFWIGKYEVTWDEYEPFMITQVDRWKSGARKNYDPEKHTLVDAVSQPTKPYMEMSFGMGQFGYPAISMTQHGANKYCQWLSAQTGHFYRLPTEAEWEYACRAGTTSAWSFGDDSSQLGQYAWFYDNANEKYQKVGQKKPNPWGLHDMHGNVMEWTADRFDPDYFNLIKENPVNPFIKPDRVYPRTVRGGGWDDDPEKLRSAFRKGSDPVWKQQDPQLPKSVWYHTDAKWLGFRIVRPVEIPSVEEMHFYWNSATGKL